MRLVTPPSTTNCCPVIKPDRASSAKNATIAATSSGRPTEPCFVFVVMAFGQQGLVVAERVLGGGRPLTLCVVRSCPESLRSRLRQGRTLVFPARVRTRPVPFVVSRPQRRAAVAGGVDPARADAVDARAAGERRRLRVREADEPRLAGGVALQGGTRGARGGQRGEGEDSNELTRSARQCRPVLQPGVANSRARAAALCPIRWAPLSSLCFPVPRRRPISHLAVRLRLQRARRRDVHDARAALGHQRRERLGQEERRDEVDREEALERGAPRRVAGRLRPQVGVCDAGVVHEAVAARHAGLSAQPLFGV